MKLVSDHLNKQKMSFVPSRVFQAAGHKGAATCVRSSLKGLFTLTCWASNRIFLLYPPRNSPFLLKCVEIYFKQYRFYDFKFSLAVIFYLTIQ